MLPYAPRRQRTRAPRCFAPLHGPEVAVEHREQRCMPAALRAQRETGPDGRGDTEPARARTRQRTAAVLVDAGARDRIGPTASVRPPRRRVLDLAVPCHARIRREMPAGIDAELPADAAHPRVARCAGTRAMSTPCAGLRPCGRRRCAARAVRAPTVTPRAADDFPAALHARAHVVAVGGRPLQAQVATRIHVACGIEIHARAQCG